MKHFLKAVDPEMAEAAVRKVARTLQAPAWELCTDCSRLDKIALDTVAHRMGGRLLMVLSRF